MKRMVVPAALLTWRKTCIAHPGRGVRRSDAASPPTSAKPASSYRAGMAISGAASDATGVPDAGAGMGSGWGSDDASAVEAASSTDPTAAGLPESASVVGPWVPDGRQPAGRIADADSHVSASVATSKTARAARAPVRIVVVPTTARGEARTRRRRARRDLSGANRPHRTQERICTFVFISRSHPPRRVHILRVAVHVSFVHYRFANVTAAVCGITADVAIGLNSLVPLSYFIVHSTVSGAADDGPPAP